MKRHTTVCTVAGSDPTGGAGAQADLKVFTAHRVDGTAVIAALTVQGRAGVTRVEAVAAELVAQQLDVVLEEVRPHAFKTGMLWDEAVIEVVAERLARRRGVPLVVDPVLAATAGGNLLRPQALPALRERLLPLADVATPNLEEAARLLGQERLRPAQATEAARALLDLGLPAVVLTGGEGEGPEAVDVLATRRRVTTFRLPRVEGVRGHGTGCAFSASLAVRLARGVRLATAVRGAKAYVHRALEAAAALGPQAPLVHTVRP